jgi:hypothetical protein
LQRNPSEYIYEYKDLRVNNSELSQDVHNYVSILHLLPNSRQTASSGKNILWVKAATAEGTDLDQVN